MRALTDSCCVVPGAYTAFVVGLSSLLAGPQYGFTLLTFFFTSSKVPATLFVLLPHRLLMCMTKGREIKHVAEDVDIAAHKPEA